ncbi:MAG: eukaryotic translation initiation factor 3 subunit H [Lasallia pustulata]|uniref:Eukaryotic translation initiation factor 3 subunit H n=1 Tax=Lasallia pustulata TaxID=136370 RepID=A0A5M8PPY8_9LECA|nr:MAG: eukaryotic translation initiation factor 3 subunit H [Lasallia pustulata]
MADSLIKEVPLKAVQMEALVVMKVIKHCSSAFPTTATGFLVGMDTINGTLQATNSFPFPTVEIPNTDGHHDNNAALSLAAVAPRAKTNAAYQSEMIRQLREVNVDANNVGWYTSANMGNFVNLNMIDNQYYYQKELNERTVAIVHDVSRSSQGSLSLRAFRLSPSFMAAFKEGKFTTESLQKSNLRYQDILVELPLVIHNSHLLTSFLHQLPSAPPTEDLNFPSNLAALTKDPNTPQQPLYPNFDSLDLSIDPFLEKTCDLLLESIETHHTELNNYQYYQRQLGREQAKITAWQQKRKAENAARTASKQDLLPEDEWTKLFKLPQEPNRLEVLLNSRQVEQYARQVDGFTASVTGKMFAVKGNLIPGELES